MFDFECGAQRSHCRIIGKALYRTDFGAFAYRGKDDAAPRGGAIDQQGAGAANSLLATKMGSREIQFIAQEIR
jgi:hypothetical protein